MAEAATRNAAGTRPSSAQAQKASNKTRNENGDRPKRKSSLSFSQIRSFSRRIIDQLKQSAMASDLKKPQYSEILSHSRYSHRKDHRPRRQKSIVRNIQIAETLFQPKAKDIEPYTSPLLQTPDQSFDLSKQTLFVGGHYHPQQQKELPVNVYDRKQQTYNDKICRTTTGLTQQTYSSMHEHEHETTLKDGDDGVKRVTSTDDTVAESEDLECEEFEEEEEKVNPAYREWKRRRREWTKGNDAETTPEQFLERKSNGPLASVSEDAYPNIYKMMVKDCRHLKKPMNLADAMRVLKAGWQTDGTWPDDPKII